MEPQSIPPYSLAADWLSKFHTWPEPIQALWLVAGSATLLGGCWLGFRAVREIVGLLVGLVAGAQAERGGGTLVYGIYRDRRGRWMVYRQGWGVQEVDGTLPPIPSALAQRTGAGARTIPSGPGDPDRSFLPGAEG